MLIRLLIVGVYLGVVWYSYDGGRTNVPMIVYNGCAKVLQRLALSLGTAGLYCEKAAFEAAKNGSLA